MERELEQPDSDGEGGGGGSQEGKEGRGRGLRTLTSCAELCQQPAVSNLQSATCSQDRYSRPHPAKVRITAIIIKLCSGCECLLLVDPSAEMLRQVTRVRGFPR